LFRTLGVRRLVDALRQVEKLDEPEDIDIVHVLGGAAWDLGLALARELDAGLALDVWRTGLITRAAALKTIADDRIALLAPDARTAESVRAALATPEARRVSPIGRKRVVEAPWGVLAGDPRPALASGRALSMMVVGSGRSADHYGALLTGLAPLLASHPDAQIFCDAHAARRANLWPIARRLKLLPNLSLIEDLESRRDLLLAGDLLLYPEAAGEQRSVLLDAMASGVVVVAAADPSVPLLQDDITARLVDPKAALAWQVALRDLLGDPQGAQRLTASARAHVERHRKASEYIRRVLGAYDQMMADRPAPPAAA
jgi:glycosyltransferase involved in cell wall biosynthesis